mmetsp:Transcript_80687/g.254620  ORF Transcript_80687/g.254620 Transcript_80687/m.254620 type:complete len:203 (+) Transcript_80687:486-1094(+)
MRCVPGVQWGRVRGRDLRVLDAAHWIHRGVSGLPVLGSCGTAAGSGSRLRGDPRSGSGTTAARSRGAAKRPDPHRWQCPLLRRGDKQRRLADMAGPATRHAQAARLQCRHGATWHPRRPHSAVQGAGLRGRRLLELPEHAADGHDRLVELGLCLRLEGRLRRRGLPPDRRLPCELHERLGLQPQVAGQVPLAERHGPGGGRA